MKKFAKVMAFMLCAALLVCGGIFGTLAYLTSTTATVTNTFTFGSVSITLTESKVNEDGTVVGTDRVTENKFHLIPGAEYTKDPTIFVGDDSEDCWIFVQVKNGIKGIEGTNTIESQMSANDWTVLDATNGIYAYKEVVSENDAIPVFTKVTISGDVANFDGYADATITVKGFAVQAQGFANAEAAWDAAGFTL